MDAPSKKLSDFLSTACTTVKRLESEGRQALYEKKSPEEHTKLMHQKAEFLTTLASDAASYIAALNNQPLADIVMEKLEDFSQNAKVALRLNSTFYMSALLYPDGYKDGDPNNLERLLDKVKKEEK